MKVQAERPQPHRTGMLRAMQAPRGRTRAATPWPLVCVTPLHKYAVAVYEITTVTSQKQIAEIKLQNGRLERMISVAHCDAMLLFKALQ
eukprot:1197790-Rhodomonas_salina.1